jgi:cyanophycin synthetase
MLKLIASHVIPGYVHGLGQPSLCLQLDLGPSGPRQAGDFVAPWSEVLDSLPASCNPRTAAGLEVARLMPALQLTELLMRLQVTAGLMVHSGAYLESVRPTATGWAMQRELRLYIPGPVVQMLKQLATPVVDYLNAALHGKTLTEEPLRRMLGVLKRLAYPGSNPRRFACQALAMGIPVIQLPGQVLQFGWGRHSRLFRSSISDGTNAVATAWAKDKRNSNALLRMARLPVPKQVSVTSLETALQGAEQIGYPVVLKPACLDQGLGVEADLRDESELRSAYSRSLKHSSDLILEKHMPGEDYRVYVVGGEMIAAAHRVPAHVVGDGASSIGMLVEAANAERLQTPRASSGTVAMALDAEAVELLARQGLSPTSRLPRGQKLRLRRSANTSRGGTSVDVTGQVHRDNVELCLRAAALLRLDIAGLDLLIPDIARSWREVGAAFCEVNAQPQMGGAHPWIFERILRRYVVGCGRVPSILVLSDGDPQCRLGLAILKALEQTGLVTALVADPSDSVLDSCRAALMNPGAIVVETDGSRWDRLGLPLDRFDLLVAHDWNPGSAARQAALALLPVHVSGLALLCKDSSDPGGMRTLQPELASAFGPRRVLTVSSAAALPAAVRNIVSELPSGG